MDGLLKHFEANLARMSEAERAEVTEGARAMVRGAGLIFPKLRGGGRHILTAMSWLGTQMAMERTGEQMRKALREKAKKAGPHVEHILSAL